MRFDWDDRKDASNLRKHGIDFDTASLAFDDPLHLLILDHEVDGEQRWQLIGMAADVALLVVVPTSRNDVDDELVRIISARKAEPYERRRYEYGA
jgi:uncharacterized DUF497 family protein